MPPWSSRAAPARNAMVRPGIAARPDACASRSARSGRGPPGRAAEGARGAAPPGAEEPPSTRRGSGAVSVRERRSADGSK